MYSFIHTLSLFSFSFVCLILPLLPHISVSFIFHLLSSFMIYEYIYSWTVVGNGWTESLSMKISFSIFSSHRDSNHFSTRYRFASFFYLSDFCNSLNRFWSSFKIFVPIPRFASNNVTSTVIEHGKKIRFLYISARISQRISLYRGISFYLTGWYFSRNLCFRKLKYLSWITSFFLIVRFNIDTK